MTYTFYRKQAFETNLKILEDVSPSSDTVCVYFCHEFPSHPAPLQEFSNLQVQVNKVEIRHQNFTSLT